MKAVISALLALILIVPSAVFAQGHELPATANMKELGLIGGTSWHSTLEYYRYINQEVNDLYGSNTNPPLVLYNLNQNEIHALQRRIVRARLSSKRNGCPFGNGSCSEAAARALAPYGHIPHYCVPAPP
jgi:hypothetical protein